MLAFGRRLGDRQGSTAPRYFIAIAKRDGSRLRSYTSQVSTPIGRGQETSSSTAGFARATTRYTSLSAPVASTSA